MLHKETVDAGTLDLIKRLTGDTELKDFFLVGGTALSLQIGHRISIDIDLFSEKEFDTSRLKKYLEDNYQLSDSKSIKNGVFGFINDIKIDILTHAYPQFRPLEIIEGIRMSSLEDIGAMKLNAIAQSGERKKDFIDMYFLLEQRPLLTIVKAYEHKYPNVNRQMAINSLRYHENIDQTIPVKLLGKDIEWKKIANRFYQAEINKLTIFSSEQEQKQSKNLRHRHGRGL